ncbi:Activating signal cointegrator 1 complex subunit 1 [Glycine soja]
MIACRSLIRVERVLKFTNTYVAARSTRYCFQGQNAYHCLSCNFMMSGRKKKICLADHSMEQQKMNSIWRPIATNASSYEESLMKDALVKSVDGGKVQETGCSTSSNISNEHLTKVGASLFRFIKGKGGSTQKKIEEDMGVKIIIPTSKEEDFLVSFGLDNVEQECRWKKIFEDSVNDSAFPGVVAILRRSHPATEGISINSGNSASEKIQAIIDETVNSRSLDYSHFISLPLAIHPELVDKLINFQHSILEIGSCMDENTDTETDSNEDESTTTDTKKVDQLSKENSGVAVELKVNDNSKSVKVNVTNIPLVSYAPKASKSSAPSDLGIDKSIFIKPKTFHLTVLMLKLWNKERIKTASEVLQECIKGSLAKARVLYAPVEETGGEDRLLHVCQVIIDAYVEAGLVLENDAKQKLKLHATVMNARHRKRCYSIPPYFCSSTISLAL